MIMYTVADDHMGENEIAQVIAFICGVIVIILMIMGLASSEWLMALGWRQGLFTHCIDPDAPTPLPFNMPGPSGCHYARDAGYIKAAAALCVVCLLADIAATLLTGLGLRSKDHRNKHKCYRIAVFCMGLALVSLLIALVIYPVFFAAELNLGNRTVWEFGWAYGVGWGAAIFLFGGAVLLLCDKESEEIYYKERKIVREEIGGGGGGVGMGGGGGGSMIGVGHHTGRRGIQHA
ncbi:transmembrane protein 47 isoform X2 [Venturia canescens]|uniref:transmembrane protein 47 isoform X2 n=1 Tax=Venturia canescens TaxID=32260 RepID=UPI001C9CC1B5|nr:transmembrane protein 47 isoform X2 [Venturia canescens]